jgi:methylenetetrahydrofolate reductase (NADPH)
VPDTWSLEITPREAHLAPQLASLLPAATCVYVPSIRGLPLSRTLESVATIRAAGLDPVPHLAARRIPDRAALSDFLRRAVGEHGVHRVLLLGGDEPAPKGSYRDSVQLLEEGLLAECGVREIGIAGYPEGHPRIAAEALADALRAKLRLAVQQKLGAYMVTQFSFAPARVLEYCSEMARAAPSLPIYVGIAGPADPAALARYAQLCGVSASLRALRQLGTGIARLVMHTDPMEQVQALAQHRTANVVGVHLYSFGGVLRTARWLREAV